MTQATKQPTKQTTKPAATKSAAAKPAAVKSAVIKPIKKVTTVDFLNSMEASGRQTVMLSIDEIKPDPKQPRKSLAAIDGEISPQDMEKLQEFAAELAENGLHQPITVREMPDGTYQLVMGERRWRAFKLNRDKGIQGFDQIECFVRQDLKDKSLRFAQLNENLQRDDLTDLETAAFLKQMLDDYPELKKQELGVLVKKNGQYISRLLALLDPKWAHVVDAGLITYASLLEHYRALPEEAQKAVYESAKAEDRQITSGDIRKANQTAKTKDADKKSAAKTSTNDAANDAAGDDGSWPFPPSGKTGPGMSSELLNEVTQVLKADTPASETYTYRGNAGVGNTIKDTGGDPVIPRGMAALNSTQLHDKHEIRMSIAQLEALLSKHSLETKGHIVSCMLPTEELRNAVKSVGGEVPEDDSQLPLVLLKRLNELQS